jgi:hypothetical protein
MRKKVLEINRLADAMAALSDEQLQAKTAEFRERHGKGATLDELLVEAFAVVREASTRVMKMRHFDVQLMGGMALHQGAIAEMGTGEGKTLVATLPAYLNAVAGVGVHLITVNDYLASRDAAWMGPLYRFLGMTVGVVASGQNSEQKREAYAADITGKPAGESFHFVLNNIWLKDNRIPPRGFTNAGFASVQSEPIGTTYADGQYWDDTLFPIPQHAARVEVRTYYQTASKEYIEFLRDENTTNTAGQVLYDQWELLGKSAPVEMTFGELELQQPCVADLFPPGNPDGILNFFDLVTYLDLYNAQSPAADLAPPFGIINFFDLAAYLEAYNAGCP